jgi:hypothetical protein
MEASFLASGTGAKFVLPPRFLPENILKRSSVLAHDHFIPSPTPPQAAVTVSSSAYYWRQCGGNPGLAWISVGAGRTCARQQAKEQVSLILFAASRLSRRHI